MTAEQKKEYQIGIEEVIAEYGFTFSRIGCPCSGSQRIYVATRGNARFELDVWIARGYWHLYEKKMKVSFGTNKQYLQQELSKLWDLYS